jgi:propanediol dehydratase small subunit
MIDHTDVRLYRHVEGRAITPLYACRQTVDSRSDYPLGSRRPDLVETPAGHRLDEITLEAARAGTISGSEIRATPETLGRQAAIARDSGRVPLAENLERAAELARVPDDELLAIYTALRPHRSTAEELEGWAVRLDGWGATATAAFVREARVAYIERGLLAV